MTHCSGFGVFAAAVAGLPETWRAKFGDFFILFPPAYNPFFKAGVGGRREEEGGEVECV